MSDHALFEPIAWQKTYELVAERWLALISSRRLGPGDALPSERELVGLYHVGRSSVREALEAITQAGPPGLNIRPTSAREAGCVHFGRWRRSMHRTLPRSNRRARRTSH